MAYVHRATASDATWQRAWTADALVDLAAIHTAGLAKHGDVAYVTATTTWYAWMDDGTWQPLGGSAGAGSGAVSRVVLTGTTRTIADTESLVLVEYLDVQGTGVLDILGDGALEIL